LIILCIFLTPLMVCPVLLFMKVLQGTTRRPKLILCTCLLLRLPVGFPDPPRAPGTLMLTLMLQCKH
jgi:hypothetical protein